MSEEQKPDEAEENMPEVEQELSQVASNPKQNMAILFGIAAVFIYLFFNLLSDSSEPIEEETPIPAEVTKPAQVDTSSNAPLIPTLPPPPTLEDPTPPPPPSFSQDTASLPAADLLPALPIEAEPELPAVNEVTLPDDNLPAFNPSGGEEADKRAKEKRKSSIILLAGTVPSKTPEELQEEANFKYRGDMNLMLGRGKMLDAIIESAINTDFGGEIRAIVSRDIYSEWGKNILVPKGSRIFGNYSTGINGAYGRVAVDWTRIDLANGYTLTLSATGMDELGRKGLQGRVDNKFKERISNSILRSFFNISLANALDSIVKPQITSQAAATVSSTATNVQNIASTILGQTTTDAEKITAICAQTQAAITDKTSALFTSIQTACAAAASAATPSAGLTSLTTAINSAATSSVQNTTASAEESKAQEASKQAFTDISDVIKTLVEEQEFKPTITIQQGTPIKIYVNQDYKFPKAAVSRKRL